MLAGLAIALALVLGDGPLANGDFEAKAGKDGRPPGWTFELGAQNGATTPESKVELDAKEKHGGKSALRFSGDESTRGWLIAKQKIEVRPGGTYHLEAWTRTAGVKPNGFGLNNCYVGLYFVDAAASSRAPARDAAAARFRVDEAGGRGHRRRQRARGLRLLLPLDAGQLWVDDLALTIEAASAWRRRRWSSGGLRRRQAPRREWKKKVGATNGTGGKDSRVELDLEKGAEGSPHSLHLAGDAETLRWTTSRASSRPSPASSTTGAGASRARTCAARASSSPICTWTSPSSTPRARCSAARASRRSSRHARLDAAGARRGRARGHEEGAGGPVPLDVGRRWFDDLELTVEKGLPVPYAGWITLEARPSRCATRRTPARGRDEGLPLGARAVAARRVARWRSSSPTASRSSSTRTTTRASS
jgi:hypothetical protein